MIYDFRSECSHKKWNISEYRRKKDENALDFETSPYLGGFREKKIENEMQKVGPKTRRRMRDSEKSINTR